VVQNVWLGPPMQHDIAAKLRQRLGRVHAIQRLGIEEDYEDRFVHRINFFDPENWYSIHAAIRNALRLTGLYWRGRKNTERVQIRHNYINLPSLPTRFDGFTILHISDMHVDVNLGVMQRAIELLCEVEYDICVLTGDFRGRAVGPFDATLEGLAQVRSHLKELVYGVLGNHDTIRMVPGMEEMGIRMLLNESEAIERGNQRIHLAGIDDAHYYRTDNIEKAASGIPETEFSILLSHTPEIYRQAAHADFKLLLSGHTHGGQVCLPGCFPITLSCDLPRHMGSGPWTYHDMVGYTSAGVGSSSVAVRFNCPPEIALHHLQCAPLLPPSERRG
jgi:uncharacterized protein